MTGEDASKYSELPDGGKVRQFSLTTEAKIVITNLSGEMTFSVSGFHEISGLAWSGLGEVTRVEVFTDGVNSWQLAELQGLFIRFLWQRHARPTIILSRCRNKTVYVQSTRKKRVDDRGLDGGNMVLSIT